VRRLTKRLDRWSSNFRLWDEWCVEAAENKLAELSAADGGAAPSAMSYPWLPMAEASLPKDETAFVISDRWLPGLEPWEVFAQRVQDELDNYRPAWR
jgi:hypothetical protein